MQWNAALGAGFSFIDPNRFWIPLFPAVPQFLSSWQPLSLADLCRETEDLHLGLRNFFEQGSPHPVLFDHC
ncbi:MAG: hypothetical protein A2284_00830 [Deltaproteobacteria bacterium RIFOXYA12_FULL_61_11]|nr:MAG: hypothetical protein A2284_00830 [Deltaproteobacteria bacterium RIFOXYA12_FULL_61_11]